MNAQDWRNAAVKYRDKKYRCFVPKLPEISRAVRDVEDFLASSDGQAALELLDAANKRITINLYREVYLRPRGFTKEVHGRSPEVISIHSAVEYAVAEGNDSGCCKDPAQTIPYIRAELDKIASEILA